MLDGPPATATARPERPRPCLRSATFESDIHTTAQRAARQAGDQHRAALKRQHRCRRTQRPTADPPNPARPQEPTRRPAADRHSALARARQGDDRRDLAVGHPEIRSPPVADLRQARPLRTSFLRHDPAQHRQIPTWLRPGHRRRPDQTPATRSAFASDQLVNAPRPCRRSCRSTARPPKSGRASRRRSRSPRQRGTRTDNRIANRIPA